VYAVSFQALDRPLHKKQAVKAPGRGGFLVPQRVFNEHLPSFSRDTLPRRT